MISVNNFCDSRRKIIVYLLSLHNERTTSYRICHFYYYCIHSSKPSPGTSTNKQKSSFLSKCVWMYWLSYFPLYTPIYLSYKGRKIEKTKHESVTCGSSTEFVGRYQYSKDQRRHTIFEPLVTLISVSRTEPRPKNSPSVTK